MTTIACIANNGDNGEPEVPLWHCPCSECTRMEWELLRDLGDNDETLGEHRRNYSPEEWAERTNR